MMLPGQQTGSEPSSLKIFQSQFKSNGNLNLIFNIQIQYEPAAKKFAYGMAAVLLRQVKKCGDLMARKLITAQ